MSDFPADSVLIERGKYSTLASERRELLKALRDDMEAIADYARRVLRNVDDLGFSIVEARQITTRNEAALERLVRLACLAVDLDALRPAAWGTTKEQAE